MQCKLMPEIFEICLAVSDWLLFYEITTGISMFALIQRLVDVKRINFSFNLLHQWWSESEFGNNLKGEKNRNSIINYISYLVTRIINFKTKVNLTIYSGAL